MKPTEATLKPANVAPRARLWRLVGFFVAWTVLAALAAWWLLGHAVSVPALVMTPQGGAPKPWLERLHEWLTLAHVNFHPAYPWLLLAPYVIWLGVRFHFDRRHWLWRAPLLLVAGVGFVLAAQEFTQRMRTGLPTVMVVATSNILRDIRVEGPSVSFFEGTPEEALREMSTRRTNLLPGTAAGKATITIQTGRIDSSASREAESNFVARRMAPDAVSSVLASNLVSAVKDQFRELALPRATSGFADWSAALNGLAYVALIGLAHAGLFYRRFREREEQAAALENRLNQARLRALQAQLQPHFLFNALNGIAALVRRDPRAAEEMITSLSELLRLALSQSDRQEIPLREEMAFLSRYLEIQQMRFGDRLRVEQTIEPAAMDGAVPALLLQPLAENAIRHGIEPSDEFGVLRISARRDGTRLLLEVEDNGVGLGQANGTSSSGLGLANVRERLEALYPNQHEFQLGPRPGGGVAARVSIPWHVIDQQEATS